MSNTPVPAFHQPPPSAWNRAAVSEKRVACAFEWQILRQFVHAEAMMLKPAGKVPLESFEEAIAELVGANK